MVELENENINYFEKYVYNIDTAEIGYSANDVDDGDLTNDVVSLHTSQASDWSMGENTPYIDMFSEAQANFEQGITYFGGYNYSTNVGAFIMDSSGLFSFKTWEVRIFGTNEEIEATLLGDSNYDGVVNVLDVVNTVNYVLGTSSITAQGAANADMNQDEAVNVLDVVSLVNQVLDS